MKFFNTSLFMAVFFLISKSNAAIIYVSDVGDDELGNGSSEAPYLTIQKGIDEAYYMDTVMVSDGIYTGGVTIDNKQISLIGESMTDTKLNVPITEPNISILNCSDTVRVENFKILRGTSSNGGGLYLNNSHVLAQSLDLSRHSSSASGGAINLILSSLKLKESQIYLSSSELHGGAISCVSSHVEVVNSDIYNNSSEMGGAIFVDPTSECLIDNVSFNNNGANNGGAIATLEGSKLTVQDSEFSGNTASGFIQSSDPDFPVYGGGGAIYQEFSDTLRISNTNFLSNTANVSPGGAIASYHGVKIILHDVDIKDNESLGAGGGLAFFRTENVIYDGGLIMDNRTSGNSGGGIFLGTESTQNNIYMPATLSHLVLANNWALYGGGGIFTWNVALELDNSTFSLNEANDNNGQTSWQGGGLSAHNQTTANIVNSVFYENIPNSIRNGGTPNSNFSVSYSLTEESWNGNNNMTGDPLFVDIGGSDFRLQLGSPCIDAGTSDLDGDGFEDYFYFNGIAPDLGAIEYVVEAPELFNAVVNEQDSSVTLLWSTTTSDDLQYYSLERSSDSTFSVIDAMYIVEENNYTEENLEWNQEYFYRVSAFVGYWTDHSNITSVILGSLGTSDSASSKNSIIPADYALHQNYPNPFNPVTTLRYDLPENGLVKITVYDMLGNVINELVNEVQNSGYKSIQWNATNNQGQPVSAGVYLYTIEAGDFRQTKKMILLK